MSEEYVIATVEYLEVWNLYGSKETAEADLANVKQKYAADAAVCRQHAIDYPGQAAYYADQADKYQAKSEHSQVMTLDDYFKTKNERLGARPITEISDSEFNYALNVLPPLNWGIHKGISSFFMSEFTDGSWTQQYAEMHGRYFCKLVNYFDARTWITRQMIEAVK